MSIVSKEGVDMNETLTVGAMREMLADLARAGGNVAGAEALVGKPAYTTEQVLETSGLRRDQLEGRINQGVIPAPVAYDGLGNGLWDDDAIQRVRDVVDNGTMWSGGTTANEDAEAEAKRATATIRLEDLAEDTGVRIDRLTKSFQYHNMELLKSQDGKDYISEEQADFLRGRAETGRLFSLSSTAVANSAEGDESNA